MGPEELNAIVAAILAAGTLSQHVTAAEAAERYKDVLAALRPPVHDVDLSKPLPPGPSPGA